MNERLRILILEDNPADAELIEHELREAGVVFISNRVETKEAFAKELDAFYPDIILSDYSLPSFDGLSALAIAQEKYPAIPFILVSGVMGEEFATESLKKGATDYVLKSNLSRLIPVINRALREAQERSRLKEVEKSLQENEKLYRLLADNTPDMITRHLPDSTYIYVSPACRALFGYDPEELMGTKAFAQIHPEDVKRVIAITQEAVRTGQPNMGRYRHRKKDGRYIWVETTGRVIKNRLTGDVEDIICVVRDITDRKKTEEALEEEEIRRRILIDQSRDGIVVLDQNGKVYEANRRFADMLGYSAEEVRQLHVWDWDTHWSREELLEKIRLIDAAGDHFETRHRRKDGTVYDVEISTNGANWGDQKLVFCVCRDITSRKSAELRLAEMQAHLLAMLESTDDFIWSVDSQRYGLITFNHGLANHFLNNYGLEIAAGMTPDDMLPPEHAATWLKFYERALRQGSFSTEYDVSTGTKSLLLTFNLLRRNEEVFGISVFGKDITELKKAEQKLLKQREFLETLIETIPNPIFYKDKEGRYTGFNRAFEEFVGKAREQMIGKNVFEVYDREPKVIPEKYHEMDQALFEHPGTQHYEGRMMNASGALRDIIFDKATIIGEGGSVEGLIGVMTDITERKRAEEELRKTAAQWQTTFDAAHDLIMLLDKDFRIARVNRATVQFLGIPADKIVGKYCFDLIHGTEIPPQECPLAKMLESKRHEETEILISKPGIWVSVSVDPVFDEKGDFIQVIHIIKDITEQKKMKERIEYLAYYDILTGLPNRNLFLDRLNQGIARAEPSSRTVAVFITNIDRFKSINDTYGSEVGDRVLKEVAGRLSTSVRKGDTIARLANDEFGIALLDIAHPDDIIMVLEKIIRDISYPLKVGTDELALSFSTGVSVYPNDGKNASDLLKSAGLALTTAKKEGTKTYQFFTADLNVKASDFMLTERNLLRAIANKEFILHYQPYWDITTRKMLGMEALIRWQSQNNELVSPAKFIPVLEDTGMIIEVGEWILREAMRQVKEWQNNEYPVVPISVNMSLVQFRQKDLADTVKRIMGECGFYPSLLTLEITESAFMQDVEFTSSVLKKLRDIGISVSIDDFGTGYSSLAYLKRFPVDNLKIDISFIREMTRDPDSASIVMAIINMAHTLNLKTIAEGIETEEQWKFLRLLRCDMGQGFYLSKPLPAEDVEKMLI